MLLKPGLRSNTRLGRSDRLAALPNLIHTRAQGMVPSLQGQHVAGNGLPPRMVKRNKSSWAAADTVVVLTAIGTGNDANEDAELTACWI